MLFLIRSPNQESIEDGRPGQAVEDWSRAEVALARYRDMPSFLGIQEECLAIMAGESLSATCDQVVRTYGRTARLSPVKT